MSKFLLRHGRRAPEGTSAWTDKYLQWIKSQVHFEHRAQEVTLNDYLHEVEHAAERIARLERSIDTAIETLAGEDACGDRGAAESARDRTA